MSRRHLFCFLCAATLIALAASARGTFDQQDQSVPPRMERIDNPTRLLVKIKPGATKEEVMAAHARVGATLVQDLPQIRWQIVSIPAGQQQAIQQLYAKEPAIERADRDTARKVAYTPNDPYWPYEWHMTNIRADVAWNTIKGSSSVVVAIMDTGLDYTHQDLAANAWTNPGEIPGNGIDDDGNGYVDDVHGYDFAYGDSDPDDNFGHGTACAGIVAAVQDNYIGVTGVAPLCQVAGVKAATDTGYFYDSANVPAFLYCADMGFKVISMSFFSDQVTQAERDAVDYCTSKGVALVAAAGNSSSVIPFYPGAYENVIGVAAIDGGNNRAWFSDYGSWVDVAAPGVSIATTYPGNNYTTGFAGTSGATPHVAGLAALLFSANLSASVADVRAALEDTAIATIQYPLGEYTNYGRIDCAAAVDRVLGLTSGSKAPRMLFAAPVGGDTSTPLKHGGNLKWPALAFFGVGFEQPNNTEVFQGHRKMPLLAQGRREVIASLSTPASPSPSGFNSRYDLAVNGTIIGGFIWEKGPGLVYVPTDMGTYSSTLLGGFNEIYRVDGQYMTCDDNGYGGIYVEMPVRKVQPHVPNKVTIEFTRGYDNCTGGTETLYLYDWSTWSYPYGSWLTVWSKNITGSQQEKVTATITTTPEHYIDPEGTMYFVLSTSGASSNGLLNADAFRVRTE